MGIMKHQTLTPDLADALRAAGDEPLSLIDPANQHVYWIVNHETHQRAMRALRHQEAIESIRRSVDSMNEGHGITLEESQRRTEKAIAEVTEDGV